METQTTTQSSVRRDSKNCFIGQKEIWSSEHSGKLDGKQVAVGEAGRSIRFPGIVELAAQIPHGLPDEAGRAVGLARGGDGDLLEEGDLS